MNPLFFPRAGLAGACWRPPCSASPRLAGARLPDAPPHQAGDPLPARRGDRRGRPGDRRQAVRTNSSSRWWWRTAAARAATSGADAVARAEPDGCTLLMGAITSHSIMATLEQKTISYKLMTDLTPIATVAAVPLVFVVNPQLPVKSLSELIAYAKANPGKLTYASSGAGAPQRMAAELFKRQAGVDILHIPYRGSGPAMTDLVGGQVLTMVETVPASLPFIKSGQLRALAVTTAERISMLPDMPTAQEARPARLRGGLDVRRAGPGQDARPDHRPAQRGAGAHPADARRQEKMLQQGAYAVPPASAAEARKRLQAEVDKWARGHRARPRSRRTDPPSVLQTRPTEGIVSCHPSRPLPPTRTPACARA